MTTLETLKWDGKKAEKVSIDLKVAKESLIHALAYSTAHRRSKKRDQRSLMITRINAASRKCGISYSNLIHNLKESNIELDRKTLSLLAFSDFSTFEKVVQESQSNTN